MNVPAVISFAYGALVLAGGWMGYKKAQSRPSLISGAVSGVLLLAAGVLALKGVSAGKPLAMGVTFVLLAFFGYRFAKGRRFMPAGMMVAASLAALILLYFTGSARP